MDFYKFLHSKDVENYLRKLNYSFTALQCLWLVTFNDTFTLNEKTEAYNYILSLPDEDVVCDPFPEGITVHQLIRKHFDYIEGLKEELKTSDSDHFYTYRYWCEDDQLWFHPDMYFKRYEDCIEHLKKRFADEPDYKIEIERLLFNSDGHLFISAEYHSGEMISIIKYDGSNPLVNALLLPFETDLPTPFKPGDVLWDPVVEAPVVLGDEVPVNIFPAVYGIAEDSGAVEEYYCDMPYVDLEFYRGNMDEIPNELKAVSECIKCTADLVEKGRRLCST